MAETERTTKRKRKAEARTRTKPKTTQSSPSKRWVAKVKTVSTYPPPGLFKRSARAIASALASHKVSPKGPASGMRMLNYFINRAGRGITQNRRTELEKAKALLSKKIERSKKSEQRKAA